MEDLNAFLDPNFFERGAFITCFESDKVILGKGGEIKNISAVSAISKSFYMKDFYNDRYVVYTPAQIIETTLSELRNLVSTWEFAPLKKEDQENEDLLYANDFNKLMRSFGKTLKKVVLVSREEFHIRGAQAARKNFFAKALNYGTGYPCGLWFEDNGMVGSTPEILFSVTGNTIKTFALAGTAAADQGEELLKSEKDLEEHRYVINDLSEKLAQFGKNIKIGETTLQPYRNIVHLKTNLEVKADKEVKPLRLVSILSPTAALGGYPQKQAMEFLVASEYAQRHPNRYFGSAFGYASESVNQALVMIRTLQWRGRRFIIESGGGVVPGSSLEKELSEIHMKRESIIGHYL